MKKFVFITVLIILYSMKCFGQSEKSAWSLGRCIEYGIENNIAVRQYDLAKDNSKITLQTSQLSRLPEVSASLGQNFYLGRAQNREGIYQDHTASTSTGGVSAGIPIFSGFRINNQIKANTLGFKAAVEDLNQAKEDISIQITGFYLQVLYTKELYKLAADQLALSKELVDITSELVAAGKSPESELYDAQANMAKEEMNLTDAANNLRTSLLDLAQAINLQEIEGFDVEAPNVDDAVMLQLPFTVSPSEIYTSYVDNKPAVKAARSRVDESRMTKNVARSAYYPNLYLGASYSNSYYYTYKLASGQSNASLADQLSQNGATSIGLSLQIPIFNKMATRNSVRSAELNIKNKQLSLDKMRQDTYKEVQQAWINAQGAYQKYLSSHKGVEASQMAMDYEEQKYLSGRSNTYQYNQVRTRLANSLSEEVQAKYNFLLRSKILSFYQGVPLY